MERHDDAESGSEDLTATAVQFLNAQHAALQSARATTVTEGNSRLQTYLSTLSAAILALAFIANATALDDRFYAFALVLLPLVYFVGLTTLARVHQIWVEWNAYQVGIDNIRQLYASTEPALSRYFLLATGDHQGERFGELVLVQTSWRWALGVSGTVTVVNSAVAGVLAGLTVRQLTSSLAIPWLAGVIAAFASVVVLRIVTGRAQRLASRRFPSQP